MNYNDALVGICYPRPPLDADEDTSNNATIWRQTETNCHPTTSDPRQLYIPDLEKQTLQYCGPCDYCE